MDRLPRQKMATGELSCLVKLSCKHAANNRQSMQGKKRERTRERRRNVWQVRSAALPLGPRGKIYLSPLAIFGVFGLLGNRGRSLWGKTSTIPWLYVVEASQNWLKTVSGGDWKEAVSCQTSLSEHFQPICGLLCMRGNYLPRSEK